jgi:threonine dehydratase
VQAFVDRVVTVGDPAIVDAIKWLFREVKIVAEPSGAITVAAALAEAERDDLPRGPVVALISGGNVEADAFARYLG